MMVRFDREGRYLDVQLPQESSLSRSQIVGHTLADLLPEDIADVGKAQIEHTFETREMQVHEYRLPSRRNTGMIDYEARLVVINDDEVLGIIRDITERKLAEQALAAARDEALEASRVKSQFLANISHELRTPLNSILNYVELLMDGMYGQLSEKQLDRLEKVHRNATNLRVLINDVLDLSKIQAGQMKMHTEPVQSDAFLMSVIEVYKPMAEQKGLSLDYLPSDTATILIDENRVRQVLINLIGNAIKFTSEGGITLTAERDGSMMWLAVTDTGIGIPPDALDTIFDEFRQVDASYTRKYEGTGLGLTISKTITEMHNGQIAVASEVGVGSTFRVSFPIAKGSK
jgi:PAS domain S-box-containing protein